MKNLNLISLLLLVCLINLSQSEGICATNPFYSKLRNFVEKHEEKFEDNTKYQNLITALDTFAESDPAVWNTEMSNTLCPEYEGQDTCCNDNIAKKLPHLVHAIIRKREAKTRKPKIIKFILKTAIRLAKCGGKKLAKKYIESDEIGAVKTDLKTCRKEQYKAHIKFLRKNMCIVCFNQQQINDNFDQNERLIVQLQSAQDLEDESKLQFNCQNEVLTKVRDFTKAFIKENLEDENKCTAQAEKWKEIIKNKLQDFNKDDINCKSDAKFMEGSKCEEALDSDGTEFDTESRRRILSDDSDFVYQANGYSIYGEESQGNTISDVEGLENIEQDITETQNEEQQQQELTIDDFIEQADKEFIDDQQKLNFDQKLGFQFLALILIVVNVLV